jgi:hypothetical protein
MPSRDLTASPSVAAPPGAAPRANVPRLLPARVTRIALLVVAAGFLVGLFRFIRASGVPTVVLPARGPAPDEPHNLADFRQGPTVRVSSYFRDPLRQHHPLFLVDGRSAPTLLEKWVSADHDRAPWVEITWRQPRTLDRVVIRHAGEYENASLTLSRYTLTCLRADGPGPKLEVADNHAGLALHPLPCQDARGVRLDAHPGKDVVRIYEIEAWGQ